MAVNCCQALTKPFIDSSSVKNSFNAGYRTRSLWPNFDKGKQSDSQIKKLFCNQIRAASQVIISQTSEKAFKELTSRLFYCSSNACKPLTRILLNSNLCESVICNFKTFMFDGISTVAILWRGRDNEWLFVELSKLRSNLSSSRSHLQSILICILRSHETASFHWIAAELIAVSLTGSMNEKII